MTEDQSIGTPSKRGIEYVVDIVKMRKSFHRRTRVRGGGYTTLKSATLGFFRSAVGCISTLGNGARGRPLSDAPTEVETDHTVTHAIKDLTLRIPKGASVGLIGRNGSGKSTFLKLVTGIYKPDAGQITVHGRVAALIELGAGFHPDFTGRENLNLAGVMHGLTREQIAERFDEMVDFAELREVIDDPVRTYSSGMFMRLGFSIAIHTDPDILLVDEVLAVGDAGFTAKCKDRIAELRKRGKTLVLVTHDLEAVERWCDEVIWLHAGVVRERGYPRRVIDAYRQFIERGEEDALFAEEDAAIDLEGGPSRSSGVDSLRPDIGTASASGGADKVSGEELSDGVQARRWGSREIEIESVDMLGADGESRRVLHPEDAVTLRISYRVHTEQDEVVFGVGLNRVDGVVVFGTNTDLERIPVPTLKGAGSVDVVIDRLGLLEGAFTVDVAVHRMDGYPYDYRKDIIHFTVRSDKREVGIYMPKHQWILNGVVCRSEELERSVA